MQAIVLTAGYGRRMQPLSNDRHKALLPVGGTTILGRLVDALRVVDVRDVTVVTGYRADEIEEFLRTRYEDVSFRFVRNDRFAETNNIVSLALALEQLDSDDDVLLLECDLIFDAGLLSRLVEHPAKNVALVDEYRTGMDGTVVSVADGLVTGVFAPSAQGRDFDYSDKFKTLNIYRFDREFCRTTLRPLVDWYAEQVDASSYYELVLAMLVNVPNHGIAAEVVDQHRWVEVDDPNDLVVGRFQFEPDRRAEVLDRTLGGHWNLDLTDFSFMRNAHFPTAAMIAAMRHALPALISSYGSAQVVLNEKLSLFLECDAARLQALNGATQVFPILRDLFSDRSVAIPKPSFGEYARMFPGARTYADRPGIDWSDVERLASESDVVVVVNPNTPTGTTVPTQDVHELARRHPATTVIVDESFIAFSGERSIREHLEEAPLPNVIVVTSLSKALGAPGLRLGYAYTCDAAVAEAIGARLPIWNLNAPAEFLLELLLKFRGELQAALAQSAVDREKLGLGLRDLEIVDEVHDSGGNFLLVALAGERGSIAAAVRAELLADFRIDVKDVTDRFPGREPRIRVAVRTAEENERLLEALRSLRLDVR